MPATRPKLVGINHVALEVGNIEEALEFYGTWFDFELRGRGEGSAFLDMGDQFLALMEVDEITTDNHRHFGLVVDDREGLRARMEEAGITFVSDKRFDFLDPWGNRVEVVAYPDIQFLKTREVLDASGHEGLRKSNDALAELKEKGITPPDDA
ncbi:VOC family protein [Roseovarius indicus]|nr:VOC family protein [Roseovarius indicus]QEW24404.1 Glutathione transferase FosA [Roseovarius indicus]SFD71095.1 Glyoxalase-like domain-containing protein [Roseovarius indicus]